MRNNSSSFHFYHYSRDIVPILKHFPRRRQHREQVQLGPQQEDLVLLHLFYILFINNKNGNKYTCTKIAGQKCTKLGASISENLSKLLVTVTKNYLVSY